MCFPEATSPAVPVSVLQEDSQWQSRGATAVGRSTACTEWGAGNEVESVAERIFLGAEMLDVNVVPLTEKCNCSRARADSDALKERRGRGSLCQVHSEGTGRTATALGRLGRDSSGERAGRVDSKGDGIPQISR